MVAAKDSQEGAGIVVRQDQSTTSAKVEEFLKHWERNTTTAVAKYYYL
jgi:hypothetical protein